MNRNKNEQYQLPNLQWFNYIYSQQEMSLMGLPQTFCCCFSLRIWCGSYLPSLLLFLAALVPNTATYWQHPAVFPLLRLGVACCSTYSCAYMLMDTTLQSSLKVLICFCFGLFFFHVEAKTKKVKRKKKNRGGGRPWISCLYWLDQYDKVTVYEKLSSDQFKRSARAKTWLGVAVEVRGLWLVNSSALT